MRYNLVRGSVGIEINSDDDLRREARREFKLSVGFVHDCEPEELLNIFYQRGWEYVGWEYVHGSYNEDHR
jgi:hypothetical protein